ncbi:MAG: tetracycline resistance MFS efflux pump [Ignavibacteriae bacterium HGW-Ignavibacteriae-3]|nr:MAG: tetracycline resistance MFS efflux pump [Ignavibacteriae bacterium HGW-Ignavibacteriae-3]
MAQKNKASLGIIFLTIFIDLMGFGILIPILPTFASKDLGISDFGIGAIVAIYSLMQFVFNPMFGRLSDRIGRRPVILFTQLLTATSYIIFAFSNSFALLFFSRMLGGLGGSNIGVAQAYIADITSKEDRAKGMGMIGAAFGLGFVFGPGIGAVLAKYGYHVAGFGSAFFTVAAFIFTFFKLPESLKTKQSGDENKIKIFDLKFAREVMSNQSINFLIIVLFLIIFSMANIYGTFALLGFKYYHFSDQQIGILFVITGLVGASIQAGFIRTLSKKLSDKTLVLTGVFFMIIGLGLLPYGGDFTGVAIVISMLAVGSGILQPMIPSMISKYTDERNQGAVLGFSQSISAFARVLGPLWGGFAYEALGYQYPFLTGAMFTFVTFIAAFFYLKPVKLETVHNV